MPDKIKEIIQKILSWWNKFTAKQKTVIIGITAAAVFTFVILIWVFTRPQYTQWQQCNTTKEAAEIIAILDSASIQYETSNDGLSIKVKNSQLSTANLALGAAGYMPDQYSINDAVSGGFSTTESDKQKQYVYYMEQKLAKDISSMESVKSATVNLHIPDQTGTLIAKETDSSAWIQLELRDEFNQDQAATVAKAVATALGNTSTENITIVDSYANLLFSGEEDYTKAGIASSMLELRSQAESMVGTKVKNVLKESQQFDIVEVGCNLDIDFAEYQNTVHEYYANSGREEGMLSHQELYEESNTNASGGIPGTDSNDETTYMYQDGDNSESSSSQKISDYLPNENLSVENLPAGIIKFENSSLALTAITYNVIKEEDAKNQGLLDGISWSDYKAANNAYVKMEVDPDFYSAVSHVTGIPEDKITIVAYQTPQFIDREGMDVNTTDVLSVVLIAIILGLLAFVVIRSMATKKEVVETEELSVENLLQSKPVESVEDIEVETKSETRKMIEKFVDENPEAAANLLRNWLNEDWG